MPNSLRDVFREFCLIYECSKAPISILKMAVMPTGFGKSLIFQSLALFTQESYVLVVVPLKSIIADQISELTSMGITACSLDDHIDKSMDDIFGGKYRIVYGSAENVTDARFIKKLKIA